MSLRKIRIKEEREVYRYRKYVVRERGRYTVIEKIYITGDRRYFAT